MLTAFFTHIPIVLTLNATNTEFLGVSLLQRGRGSPCDPLRVIFRHEISWPAWLTECLTALSIYVIARTLYTHQNREYTPHANVLRTILFLNCFRLQGHLP